MRRSQVAAEEVEPVWIEGSSNTLRAVILIPRHPLIRERARFFVLKPKSNVQVCTLDELADVLASFGLGDSFGGGGHAGGDYYHDSALGWSGCAWMAGGFFLLICLLPYFTVTYVPSSFDVLIKSSAFGLATFPGAKHSPTELELEHDHNRSLVFRVGYRSWKLGFCVANFYPNPGAFAARDEPSCGGHGAGPFASTWECGSFSWSRSARPVFTGIQRGCWRIVNRGFSRMCKSADELDAAGRQLRAIARQAGDEPNLMHSAIHSPKSSDARGKNFWPIDMMSFITAPTTGKFTASLIIPRRWLPKHLAFFCMTGPNRRCPRDADGRGCPK